MGYRLVLKSRAENDLSEGIEWYESRRKGLGLIFLNTIQKYLVNVQKSPLHYPLKRNPYREAFIKKFPYIIIYEVTEEEIVVYSIFNTYRNPHHKP